MKRVLHIMGILLCLSLSESKAQDIHFSQFSYSPINLNPALCGLYPAEWRFNANFRNQWLTVPVNYNTLSLSVEKNLHTLKNKDRINAGISFYFDKAGDSRYTTLYPAISLSYNKAFGKNKNHYLSLGFKPAVVYRQMDYSHLRWDSQYNGEYFDPNAITNEERGIVKKTAFDFSAGIAYAGNFKGGHSLQLGFSVSHINRPLYTFKSKADVRLNPRYSANLRMGIKVSPKSALIFDGLYSSQGKKYEGVGGMLFKTNLKNNYKSRIDWYVGPYYRWNDAVVLFTAIDINQCFVGFSYDVNSSSFRKATGTYGAIEMSFVYLYSSVKKSRDFKSVCPLF